MEPGCTAHMGAHMGPIWVPYRLLAGYIYTEKSACATSTRSFGEVGVQSPLQLSMRISSRTHFAKIEDKKVIAKISSKNLTAGV